MPKESDAPERVINTSEFRLNFSRYLRHVAENGEELIITKFGRPVVKLVPYRNPQSIIGMFKDECKITGDIMELIDVEWNAMKDDDEEDYYS